MVVGGNFKDRMTDEAFRYHGSVATTAYCASKVV